MDPRLEFVIAKLRAQHDRNMKQNAQLHAEYTVKIMVQDGIIQNGNVNGIKFKLGKELTSKNQKRRIQA